MGIAWFVAMNLRGTSISVSPLLPFIQKDMVLTYAQAGFLFSVPTIMMSACGFPGGWLADTVGMKRTITIGLVLILIGCTLRVTAPGFLLLVFWTAVLGAGMGIAGPGLTRMVKDNFPDLPGTATGIYTTGIVTGAAMGSFLTFPYLTALTGSWRGTFLIWGILALVVLVGWILLAPVEKEKFRSRPNVGGIWMDKTVWKLNLIFLLQGVIFYSLTSWIPTYYQELGLSLKMGSGLLTIFILLNLPSSLVIPFVADRVGGAKVSLVTSCLILFPAVAGMIYWPLAFPWLYTSVIGLAMGGIFALSFALPLEYVKSELVGSVAGANLLVGYAGTCFGPIIIGYVHDVTASFRSGWVLVLVVIVFLLLTALSLPRRSPLVEPVQLT